MPKINATTSKLALTAPWRAGEPTDHGRQFKAMASEFSARVGQGPEGLPRVGSGRALGTRSSLRAGGSGRRVAPPLTAIPLLSI